MPKSKENAKNSTKGSKSRDNNNKKLLNGSRFSMGSKSKKSKDKKSRVHDDIHMDYEFRQSLEAGE